MTEQNTPKMTHDEMIDVLKGLVFGTFDRTTAKEREALDMAISDLSAPSANVISIDQANAMIKSYVSHYEENKGEWIPISSIDEIPKEGAYWVTFEYKNGYRETSYIGWDTFHKHWDDEEGWALDDGDYIIAYMPYFEPEPYNPKSE